MSILVEILTQKRSEIAERKALVPVSQLEKSPYFSNTCPSISQAIHALGRPAIIAEFKRRSPSKGVINANVPPATVAKGYETAGASAVSVLTDGPYFQGSILDLKQVRDAIETPILRKDFILDEYQILETKSIGADILLLIAAALTPQQTRQFSQLAKSIGLEVLLEVHDEEELAAHLNHDVHLVGVNNRNLKTFDVNLETSEKLAEQIPEQFIKVSESGISDPEVVIRLAKKGYRAFLMGENFMKATDPGRAAKAFIKALNK